MLLTVLSAFAALPSVPAKAAADPGTLYLAMQQDMPDFNTWNLASNSVWKANVINWGFEGLAGMDYNMLPYPLLAESWDFDEVELEVTVYLREGIMFHDMPEFGYEAEELTADDVVFTYHAARSGTTYSSNIINAFDISGDGDVDETEIATGVWKIDTYTVGMKMAGAYGQFFSQTLGVPIVPESIWTADWNDDGDPDGVNEDGTFNVLWDSPLAIVSTGAYKYKEGIPDTYRVMERNEDYWGKEFETPAGYPIYPPNVKALYFKIYGSIDTAILALQAGEVDEIMWAVTAGRVPSLQADPNIELEFLEDNGYFYLAFNQKLEPMNHVGFREAVSYLIDKDQVVNVYMGGFGAKGTACEPPYWGDWHNESVEAYPYDDPFDDSSTIPEDILDDAGLIDANGDGWRDLPDESPMDKIIILTPPADYDPIRIRAGQMIAKNMREVGINAEAKAIDFDTLVARLQSMDYQMLIIGWSLTSDPVANVFDILGPKSNSNTFGFWAEEDPNPFYSDLLGVNTLADAETQEMARQVEDLAALARGTFDVEEQIFYTRWGQGVLADAIPCNPIYYRVNIFAHNTRWTGYLPFLGDIVGPGANPYSLANLELSGAAGGAGGVVQSLNIGMSLPGNVPVGGSIAGHVIAVDDFGEPVAGATVALASSGVAGGSNTVSVSPTSGTTDANGIMAFTVTGTANGYSFVNATATLGSVTATDQATVSSVTEVPATLALSVMVDEQVLMPGDTTTVHLYVTDESGDPVEDANVSIDPNLISYGQIDGENWAMTDASGHASMTYEAPTEIIDLNTHLTLTLSYAVQKEGYAWVAATAANLLIYNDELPDWVMVRVTDVTTTALESAANATTITVEAVDDSGAALTNHRMAVMYSDESMVFDPVTEVVTDGSGEATIDVQVKDMDDSGAVKVTVVNSTVLNAVAGSVTLTYVGSTPPATELYGGYITYTESAQYMGPLSSVEATAWIWDSSGAAADGINASLVLSATPYGSLVWCDDINWDSLWDWLGINMVTEADGGNYVTSGPMNTWFDQANYDDWMYDTGGWLFWEWGDMTGVEIVGGEYTFTVYGVGVAHADLVGSIYVVPEGLGFFNDTTLGYQIDGQTSIVSEYVIGRSYEVVTVNYEIADPVLMALETDYETTDVMAVVTDKDNEPVEDATVLVYENSVTGNAAYDVTDADPTDADGEATAMIEIIGRGGVVAPASAVANVYVKPEVEGAISMFGQTQLFIFVQRTFATIEAVPEIIDMGAWGLNMSVEVTDFAGDPVEGLVVEMTLDSGEVVESSGASDADGMAWFVVNTPELENVKTAFMTAQVKTGGPGWELSLAKAKIALQNKVPSLYATMTKEGTSEAILSGGSIVEDTDLVLEVNAFDANGLETLSVTIDGDETIVDEPAAGTFGDQQKSFSDVLTGLALGNHTVVVNATDALGVSTEQTYYFSVITAEEAEEEDGGGSDALLMAIGAIGWIVAAIVIVLLVMKMRPKGKAPAAEEMEPGEPEVEPPMEEPEPEKPE
jgi:peptide/nickel transport system substrate-binding protein